MFIASRTDVSISVGCNEIMKDGIAKNIRIHHECSCRIGKSHPRGRNFNQGRGLPTGS